MFINFHFCHSHAELNASIKSSILNIFSILFEVAPAEIERLLLNHPSVDEVAVVGIPDPLSGEVPKAFVVKKSGHSLSADEVAKYVASERLASEFIIKNGIAHNPSPLNIPQLHEFCTAVLYNSVMYEWSLTPKQNWSF